MLFSIVGNDVVLDVLMAGGSAVLWRGASAGCERDPFEGHLDEPLYLKICEYKAFVKPYCFAA